MYLYIQGATVSLVGLAGGLSSVPLVALILNHITLQGICVGSLQQLKALVSLYQTGKVSFNK